MAAAVIRYIPNTLTTLRLLLAIPICYLIIQQRFEEVLWLSLFAGLSDGADGWLARKFNAQSRYGALVDPLSDKALLTGSFISFAVAGLIPWWISILVVARDALILGGAATFYFLYGRFTVRPSVFGKASTLVQIAFAIALIAEQVQPFLPQAVKLVGIVLLVGLAVVSGSHYVWVWGKKAATKNKEFVTDNPDTPESNDEVT